MNVPSLGGGSSAPRRLEEVFTASGSSSVPSWANRLTYYVVSAGGGGGRGAAQSGPGSAANAGAGGASGVILRNTIPVAALRGAAVALAVGAAGAGQSGSSSTRGGNSVLAITGGPTLTANGGNPGSDIYGGLNDHIYDGSFTMALWNDSSSRIVFFLDGGTYVSPINNTAGGVYGSGIGTEGCVSGNTGVPMTSANASATASIAHRSGVALNIRIGATTYLLSGTPAAGVAATPSGNSPNVGAGAGYGYGGTGSSACGPGYTVGNGGNGGPGIIIMIWEE